MLKITIKVVIVMFMLLWTCCACGEEGANAPSLGSYSEEQMANSTGMIKETEEEVAFDETESVVDSAVSENKEDITYGEFRSLVEAEITRQAEELMKQKESWFAEYNGEKLLKTDTATFYRADEGETLEQILKCMVDSWYADLPKATATGRSVITDYFLDMESQCIYDADQVNDETIAFVWDWWPGAKEFSGLTAEDVEEYIRMVLPMSFHVDGRPMSDGVWLVPKLEIYIRYDGRMGYFSWEEYVDEYGYEMKNGCMPYYREGISSTFHYILIQEENVYRLQAADAMGYDWELFGNYSEWLKLKKNQ